MDSMHCTFPPGSLYVTNHCKLTPWTLKPDGFLIKHRLPGAAWSQFLIWPRPRHQGYRPTRCRGTPQGGLLWQHELTSRRLASEWEKCSGYHTHPVIASTSWLRCFRSGYWVPVQLVVPSILEEKLRYRKQTCYSLQKSGIDMVLHTAPPRVFGVVWVWLWPATFVTQPPTSFPFGKGKNPLYTCEIIQSL